MNITECILNTSCKYLMCSVLTVIIHRHVHTPRDILGVRNRRCWVLNKVSFTLTNICTKLACTVHITGSYHCIHFHNFTKIITESKIK